MLKHEVSTPKILMKIKMLAILLILCVFFCGCSDERLSQPLEVAFFGEANKISPEGALGPPPPHIQEFLWGGAEGRYENTLNILLQYEQWKELGEGESFKPVVDLHFNETLVLTGMRRQYYTKYIDAGGIAIIGSHYILDQYFYAACELVFEMTSKRPELRDLLAFTDKPRPNLTGATYVPSPGFMMILYDPDQGAAAIPERFPKPAAAIGWCGGARCVVAVGARVVLTEDSPDVGEVRIDIASVFIHEFAHAMNFAIRLIDPTFDTRLAEAYEEAVENDSAFSNSPFEHWAVTAQNWFRTFALPNGQGELSYARFQERNPRMHALMAEWFDFKYLGHIDRKRKE